MNSRKTYTGNEIYKIVKRSGERIANSRQTNEIEAKAKETYNSAMRAAKRFSGSNKEANRKEKERGW